MSFLFQLFLSWCLAANVDWDRLHCILLWPERSRNEKRTLPDTRHVPPHSCMENNSVVKKSKRLKSAKKPHKSLMAPFLAQTPSFMEISPVAVCIILPTTNRLSYISRWNHSENHLPRINEKYIHLKQRGDLQNGKSLMEKSVCSEHAKKNKKTCKTQENDVPVYSGGWSVLNSWPRPTSQLGVACSCHHTECTKCPITGNITGSRIGLSSAACTASSVYFITVSDPWRRTPPTFPVKVCLRGLGRIITYLSCKRRWYECRVCDRL